MADAGAKDDLLKVQTDGEVEAELLARALARFDSSIQPRLLQLLEEAGDRTRLAAMRSLGQVGDLEAIRHLRRIADQDRFFESALAQQAEDAINEIKGRFEGSQRGEISISEVEPLEGAVSPSDDSESGGEVSLV